MRLVVAVALLEVVGGCGDQAFEPPDLESCTKLNCGHDLSVSNPAAGCPACTSPGTQTCEISGLICECESDYAWHCHGQPTFDCCTLGTTCPVTVDGGISTFPCTRPGAEYQCGCVSSAAWNCGAGDNVSVCK
jgi:hypothetical protein